MSRQRPSHPPTASGCRLQLPPDMRLVDLIKLANAAGKRVRWTPDGLGLKPVLEPHS
ncbi:hypothetical protein HCH_02864 [Hahella chejuensis KCTC 2396]|uniref:Uncharacterized protein n=1 Tax=Hahella chejuensis (strain KCTC 2396) TaxID=349521 RepID=Q2SI83_HAHCH|nr:hypothetical protein [Hahella chejuensis]ABC29641.1 hypothetical protein HCH_02864 [Hahella chejuensis KCTC 2396]